MGDIYAQLAANRTGERRFLEMLERFGVETVAEAAKELQDYSERLAREAIRAIPDGLYEAEDFVDDNGVHDRAAQERGRARRRPPIALAGERDGKAPIYPRSISRGSMG